MARQVLKSNSSLSPSVLSLYSPARKQFIREQNYKEGNLHAIFSTSKICKVEPCMIYKPNQNKQGTRPNYSSKTALSCGFSGNMMVRPKQYSAYSLNMTKREGQSLQHRFQPKNNGRFDNSCEMFSPFISCPKLKLHLYLQIMIWRQLYGYWKIIICTQHFTLFSITIYMASIT